MLLLLFSVKQIRSVEINIANDRRHIEMEYGTQFKICCNFLFYFMVATKKKNVFVARRKVGKKSNKCMWWYVWKWSLEHDNATFAQNTNKQNKIKRKKNVEKEKFAMKKIAYKRPAFASLLDSPLWY